MVEPGPSQLRGALARRVLLLVVLACLAIALGAASVSLARQSTAQDGVYSPYHLFLSLVVLALLAVVLVTLGWMLARLFGGQIDRPISRDTSGPPVDAWQEAGKRFQLSGDEEADLENSDESPPER